jgi:hypothetical protein
VLYVPSIQLSVIFNSSYFLVLQPAQSACSCGKLLCGNVHQHMCEDNYCTGVSDYKQVGLVGKLTVQSLSILETPDRGLTILNELFLFHTAGHTERVIIFKVLLGLFPKQSIEC